MTEISDADIDAAIAIAMGKLRHIEAHAATASIEQLRVMITDLASLTRVILITLGA